MLRPLFSQFRNHKDVLYQIYFNLAKWFYRISKKMLLSHKTYTRYKSLNNWNVMDTNIKTIAFSEEKSHSIDFLFYFS